MINNVHIFGLSVVSRSFGAFDFVQGRNFTHQLLCAGAAEGAATAG